MRQYSYRNIGLATDQIMLASTVWPVSACGVPSKLTGIHEVYKDEDRQISQLRLSKQFTDGRTCLNQPSAHFAIPFADSSPIAEPHF